ncbi:MAG: glycosyltransferase, partial [Chitinivibrionales bacterium]
MSEDHSIARSIAQHLRALRLQISRRQITWIDFALSAARLYIADHKPMRAAALLATLTELDQEQRLQAALLEAAIESAQDSGHKSCSLTMIVCDEGDNIVSCLDTVDAIMDELVICDTGSTDDTVGKARMYGATIVYHEWEQDFSKARNAAIDHARGDWIFWMDADDRLEAPSAHTLQTLWRTGSAQAAAVRIRSLVAKGGEVEFMQVRLFPRHHRLRFERRIHEQIMFAVQRQAI